PGQQRHDARAEEREQARRERDGDREDERAREDEVAHGVVFLTWSMTPRSVASVSLSSMMRAATLPWESMIQVVGMACEGSESTNANWYSPAGSYSEG